MMNGYSLAIVLEIIINNKNDTLIPRKNVLIITQSFLFSPREKRKGGRNI